MLPTSTSFSPPLPFTHKFDQAWNFMRGKKKRSSRTVEGSMVSSCPILLMRYLTVSDNCFTSGNFLFILRGYGSALVPMRHKSPYILVALGNNGFWAHHPVGWWFGQPGSFVALCSASADPAYGEWLATGWGNGDKRLFMSHDTAGCLARLYGLVERKLQALCSKSWNLHDSAFPKLHGHSESQGNPHAVVGT